jgi:hypothetical protein
LVHCTYADLQVLASQDEELICLSEIALGEVEIEVELGEAGRRNDFGMSAFLVKMLMTDIAELAQRHLRSALSRANRIKSRGLVDRLTSSLALIAQIGNDETDKEEMTELWAKQQAGDAVRLADEREQIKQFGRMVRMVGLRVAEGWC